MPKLNFKCDCSSDYTRNYSLSKRDITFYSKRSNIIFICEKSALNNELSIGDSIETLVLEEGFSVVAFSMPKYFGVKSYFSEGVDGPELVLWGKK